MDSRQIDQLLTEGAAAIAQARAARATSRFLSSIARRAPWEDRRGPAALPRWDKPVEPHIARPIAGSALCIPCIAFKTGALRTDVDAAITSYGDTIVVARTVARCDGCLKQTVVHWLN